MTRPYTVYRLYAEDETLLYVGCSGAGRERLVQHSKAQEWWREVSYIHLEHFDDGREAHDRERFLIEQLHPKHNRRFRLPDSAKKAVSEPSEATP